MDQSRIAELLRPFITPLELTAGQLNSISTYIDLLVRWNSRINLTAIRDPEEIVTRHFGESLFAARHLFAEAGPIKDLPALNTTRVAPGLRPGDNSANNQRPTPNDNLLDLGSGAGFPGIPIKIWAPAIHITLVESQQKKATFLREVCRALTLTNIDVLSTRAEQLPPAFAKTVTLRAVERFDSVVPTATRLLAPAGRLALLIGRDQIASAKKHVSSFHWFPEFDLPLSNDRILLIGQGNQ